jgi:hypothetical protein
MNNDDTVIAANGLMFVSSAFCADQHNGRSNQVENSCCDTAAFAFWCCNGDYPGNQEHSRKSQHHSTTSAYGLCSYSNSIAYKAM